MGDDREQRQNDGGEPKKNPVIKVPAFQGVAGSSSPSAPSTSAPANRSFSEAFSFIKTSEFYTPPPPPPPPDDRGPSNTYAADSSSCSSSSTLAPQSVQIQNRNAILVSHRQKGNPLLKHIRNVKWVFADVICDYLLGQSSCALYLSLRYHLLHPDYLYFRIRELLKNFKLRVILCHVDVDDVIKPLLEVTRTALLHDCTLLCGWSLEECGRYLETIKVYENKSADIIREQMDTDYLSRFTHALTAVRRVNKTDVLTLGSAFGSLSRVMDASMEELARCPGIGERKVKRLYDTFHEPFKRTCSQPTMASQATSENKIVDELSRMNDMELPNEDEDQPKITKEPEVTVKSALTAAFTKYADKVHRQEENSSIQHEGPGADSAGATKENKKVK